MIRSSLLMTCVVALLAAGRVDADDKTADEGLRAIQGIEAAFQRAIQRAEPSVVSIFLVSPPDDGRFRNEFGAPTPRLQRNPDSYWFAPSGFGSGIIIDAQGRVLTCYHVVRAALKEPRLQLAVHTFDGKRFNARIYAADPRSDLAVVQLQGIDPGTLKPIDIADGAKLFRGQFVLAIGNSFGVAAPDGLTSASWGIVSNLRRRPSVPADYDPYEDDLPIYLFRSLVQTDARLNMGISGGALIDTQGRMVGVTVALAAANGLETPGGFAIPTDALTRRIIDTLKSGREVEYGFLGITPRSITAEEAAQIGCLPVAGTYVENVFEFLPAYRAGLRQGDIITTINGRRVTDENELILAVGSLPVSTILDTEIVRQKQVRKLKLPLAKYPVKGDIIATNKRPLWNGIRVDHLSVLASPRAFGFDRERFQEGGVSVRDVEPGSPADQKGIRPGQVITKVNGKTIYTPDEFDAEVARAKPPVRISVHNGPDQVFEAPKPSNAEKP